MLPCPSLGQSFTALWKQADEAAGKELPKTQIEILEKIEAKAEGEKAYGQLLKASLKKAQVEAEVGVNLVMGAMIKGQMQKFVDTMNQQIKAFTESQG